MRSLYSEIVRFWLLGFEIVGGRERRGLFGVFREVV